MATWTHKIKATALLIALVPTTAVLEATTQAGACPADLDTRFAELGQMQFPERIPADSSTRALRLLDDDYFALIDDGAVQIIGPDLRRDFVILGDFNGVTKYVDGFVAYGDHNSVATDLDGVVMPGGIVHSEAISSGGIRARFSISTNGVASGIQFEDEEGEPVASYGDNGYVDESLWESPSQTANHTKLVMNVQFLGDGLVIVFRVTASNRMFRDFVYTATVSPSGVELSTELVLPAEQSFTHQDWQALPQQRRALVHIELEQTVELRVLDWSSHPEFTATVDTDTLGSARYIGVTAAGDSSGWWIRQSNSDSDRIRFVDSAGGLSPALANEWVDGPWTQTFFSLEGDQSLYVTNGSSVRRLQSLTNPADFVRGALTDQVFRLYRAGLGRKPDLPGLTYWKNIRASGVSLNTIAEHLIAAPEFTDKFGKLSDRGFVELLYRFVLERGFDDEGATYWTNELTTGNLTRSALLVSFSESVENIVGTSTLVAEREGAVVLRLYQAFFQREPDVEGFCWYTTQIEPRWSDPSTRYAEMFVASPEFRSQYGNLNNSEFVELVYANILDRRPDNAGYRHWLGQLDAGVSRAVIMSRFMRSSEFIVATDTVPYD